MLAVTIPRAIDDGLRILKAYFWPCILIVIILSILDSFGQGSAMRSGFYGPGWWMDQEHSTNGFLVFIIAILIKPVFAAGSNLVFLQALRGDGMEVKDIVRGFDSRELYIDIILANLLVWVCIILGFICLILPGIYIACRSILTPYLVIDKGLGPREAFNASWELMRDFWFNVIWLGFIAAGMCLVGLLLLFVGIFPAVAWIKGMFASFYQQVIDVHDEEFLRSLDIEP